MSNLKLHRENTAKFKKTLAKKIPAVSQEYRPFSQLPYCCVPATLQWILYRRGLDILNQESIGADLGLRLPLKGKKLFQNSKIIFVSKEPKNGFGTQIERKRYSIQHFFSKNKIPLRISDLISPLTKQEFKEIIGHHLAKNNDVILRYNNQIFKQVGEKNYGHFSVITDLDEQTERTIIGDPEIPHFKVTTLDQIFFSISNQIDGIQRGIYIVTKTKNRPKQSELKITRPVKP